MRTMLGGRDQMMYGRDAGGRVPSYDGYRNTDHGYNNNMLLPPSASSALPHNQSRFHQPGSYKEQLNYNYDAFLKKDYMNQSDMIPGGSSSGWAGATASTASYRTGGIGPSAEARGGRLDSMSYSK
jgi:hypothetical protein